LLAEVARNADLATGASHFWSIGPTLSWLIGDRVAVDDDAMWRRSC
jgi:hypothetical protein